MSLHDIWRGDVMPLSGVAVSIGRNSFDPPAPVVPCFDIHAREFDLYDGEDIDAAFTADGSGIITFDSENNRLLLNPSMSGATPICTAVYFDGYNSSSQNISNSFGPGTVIDIDTQRTVSDATHFTLASDVVTVWAAGTYEITVRAGTDNISGTARLSIRHWLERSSGGGAFAEVPGSRGWTYARNSTNGEDTSLCTIILQDVAPGDQFRIKSAETSTGMIAPLGPQTEPNGYGLTFEKLE
ncbi:MAG: hypothetical protein K5880_14350 [Hydrogenophaga sp.]|uniref:hypothetical protein n=1 Tax=Hydrogenophaga sp. TaxID=1904254 RepID=UPI002632A163|nr:hypothetical protein [Hydrogenophaga sp.]MCV0439805.1 hypothetical protein [Hydrogenophaga sp.]